MTDIYDRPTFSIVIAVRNGAATLQHCLDSVFAQRDASAEVIVIDGGSADGTREIIERNAARLAHWRSEPDRGIYEAFNKGLGVSRGEWLLFLGSDDRLASETVLAEVAARLPDPEGGMRIAYGRLEVVAPDGSVTMRLGTPWEESRRDFLDHNTIPHGASFQHRSLYERNGPFDPGFRIAGDYEVLLRELKHCDPEYLDVLVTVMGAGGISQREDSLFLATREAYRARYVNGLERMPEWASFRVARALMHEAIRRVFGLENATRAARAYKRAIKSARRSG
jgi:glycosyltransferase involved in cell wall biosynthesis